ncbi:hypothetical protein HELRODRAFT_170620 [Helobdella robusta]|uniref:Uncharacterized protein n=1 Tax=Helobdella robusta TaxID=6412 RepID=T1F392_HELRO|nr:hypothetical protein HELRODRAFT_170620 [Helobdella robusta]ESO07291.1 hypothetical protein HELRODRAFT_170620 [Helobdella robusta]
MKIHHNFDLTRENTFRLGPLFNASALPTFCLDLSILEECLSPFKKVTCTDKRSHFFLANAHTFIDGSSFLCKEVKKFGESNITKCFSKEKVKFLIHSCEEFCINKLSGVLGMFNLYEMGNSIDNFRGIIEKHMTHLTSYEKCKRFVIERECGADVAKWYSEYILKIIDAIWLHFDANQYIKLAYSYLVFSVACGCIICIHIFFKYYRTNIEGKLNFAVGSSDQNKSLFKTLYEDTQRLLNSTVKSDTLSGPVIIRDIYDYD